ncbi:MAG: CoA transferase [Dehalococcoidales bacterium]|nr:CoA transferase [Dehalococcoidales bacterium]
MAAVLEGIKVIDLSQVAAVPLCARHLADFGADVLHIENPVTGDSFRGYQLSQEVLHAAAPSEFGYNWENYNRNKRSVTVDVAQETGRDIIYRLVEQADVLVTNFRPSELERYRMDYKTLSRQNPRLVWGCVTGYGREGLEKDAPAYDATALWYRSGIAHMLTMPGSVGAAMRPAFGDNIAALVLAYGIMLALFQRERTGVGQEVDVSLLHTGLYQLGFDIAGALVTGLDYADWRAEPPAELVEQARAAMTPIAAFHRSRSNNPLVGAYITSDARVIVIVALQPDRYWGRVCRAIGREDMVDDSRYSTFEGRAEHCGELQQVLTDAFINKTLDEWKVLLAGVPFAAYQSLREAANDPQARANGFFVSCEHPTQGPIDVIASPVKLGESPATYRMPAPEFGQHTEEVLLEYGYDWDDIIRFKEQGVIA